MKQVTEKNMVAAEEQIRELIKNMGYTDMLTRFNKNMHEMNTTDKIAMLNFVGGLMAID